MLLAHIWGRSRDWLLAHPEAILPGEEQGRLEALIELLKGGQPLPYVLGKWEFFGLEFSVTPQVLIPRPETELLVEEALNWLRAGSIAPQEAGNPAHPWAAEVGTGSGCIAIALAVNHPALRVIASDVAWPALCVARENIRKHDVGTQVQLVQADLLPPSDWRFDLVCANLPYIASAKLDSLDVARHEPRLALDGGADGLAAIGRLVERLPGHLRPGGLLLLEIEAHQGEEARKLCEAAFPQASILLKPDLAGHDRLVRVEI